MKRKKNTDFKKVVYTGGSQGGYQKVWSHSVVGGIIPTHEEVENGRREPKGENNRDEIRKPAYDVSEEDDEKHFRSFRVQHQLSKSKSKSKSFSSSQNTQK